MLNSVQIDNNPDLVRDMASKAVVSVDVQGLSRYKETRKRTLMTKQEMSETKARLEQIEREMSSLRQIVNDLAVLRNGK
jgi:urease alpha subunit